MAISTAMPEATVRAKQFKKVHAVQRVGEMVADKSSAAKMVEQHFHLASSQHLWVIEGVQAQRAIKQTLALVRAESTSLNTGIDEASTG